MIVKHVDSLTKIVEYLTRVSIAPIEFNNKIYAPPDRFIISALLFRRFNCPDKCGGCCGRFTLDYFSPEEGPKDKIERTLTVNNVTIPVWSYMQGPCEEKKHCDFMNNLGRCTVHDYNPINGKPNPFSCQMEPIKLLFIKRSTYLIKRPFGRGWAMTKYDGTKGAICEFFDEGGEKDFDWNIKILKQLDKIASDLKLNTVLPQVMEYVVNTQKLLMEKKLKSPGNFTLWTKDEGFQIKQHVGMPSLF